MTAPFEQRLAELLANASRFEEALKGELTDILPPTADKTVAVFYRDDDDRTQLVEVFDPESDELRGTLTPIRDEAGYISRVQINFSNRGRE